jgi:arylsulfatase A-like enzyme
VGCYDPAMQFARAPRPSLAVAASVVLCACAPAGDGDASSGPNGVADHLLLISIDTLRADALGSYGSESGATPHLDRLAEQSVRFANVWAPGPKTAPSHMTLFTGLPPRIHGVGNLKTSGSQRLSADIATLPEVLANVGFATAGFTGGGNVKGELGFDRGFEIYDDQGQTLPKKLPKVTNWLELRGVQEDHWFAFVHTYQVHDPYLPSPEFAVRFADPEYSGRILGTRQALGEAIERGDDLAPRSRGNDRFVANFWRRVNEESEADLAYLHQLYTAGVAEMDRDLGVALRRWESNGLLEDALVVLTSDHGEEFGEHGRTMHHQLWSETLRVPLLVRLPDGTGAGRVIETAVQHVDLLPSVLDLLGVEAESPFGGQDGWIGTSWAPWVLGEAPPANERSLLAEHRSLRDHPLDTHALRRGDLLLYISTTEGPRLFDMRADPSEQEQLRDANRKQQMFKHSVDLRERWDQLAAGFAAGEAMDLDDQTTAELEALGYLGDE